MHPVKWRGKRKKLLTDVAYPKSSIHILQVHTHEMESRPCAIANGDKGM